MAAQQRMLLLLRAQSNPFGAPPAKVVSLRAGARRARACVFVVCSRRRRWLPGCLCEACKSIALCSTCSRGCGAVRALRVACAAVMLCLANVPGTHARAALNPNPYAITQFSAQAGSSLRTHAALLWCCRSTAVPPSCVHCTQMACAAVHDLHSVRRGRLAERGEPASERVLHLLLSRG